MQAPLYANALTDAVTGLGQLWRLWLPLLVGAAAIYLLLPRPRAYPLAWGALVGAAALLLGGGLLVRSGAVSAEAVLFYAFSGIALVSATLLVTQQNPARAALSFAMVILSTCGLFLLLGAPFLTAATIIIYAGAIIVTFLFVLMLAQQEGRSDADARSREPLFATITGFVLLATILYVLQRAGDTRQIEAVLAEVREAAAQESVEAMRQKVEKVEPGGTEGATVFSRARDALKAQGQHHLADRVELLDESWFTLSHAGQPATVKALRQPLEDLATLLQLAGHQLGKVPLPKDPLEGKAQAKGQRSTLSGTPGNTPPLEVRRNRQTQVPELPAQNAAYLGRSLFTDYLLPVEIGGLLLLVATVGAIAIAQRKEGDRGE